MGFRRSIKLALATAAEGSGALGLMRRLHRRSVHVFGYHRVVPDIDEAARTGMRPLCVSTRTFAAHLDHLSRCYDVWRIDDAIDLLAGDRPPPARDVAVITFDDGYRDALVHAAPLLQARGMPATIFVTTGATGTGQALPHDRLYALMRRALAGRQRLLLAKVPDRFVWPLARAEQALADEDPVCAADAILGALPGEDLELLISALEDLVGAPAPEDLARIVDWDDLERLLALGFTVGAHGASHGHLPLEDGERLVAEVAGPRTVIARRLGVPPSVISYPAGRHDARVVAVARAAGYRAGLTTEDRRNGIGADLYRLGRKVLTDEHGLDGEGRPARALVAAQLDGFFSSLGLSRAVPGDRGLESPWL